MGKIELDKRQVAIIGGAAFVVVVFILIVFVYRPLGGKIHSMREGLRITEQELANARNIVGAKDRGERKGHLLALEEVSLAIDEMTKTGRALRINFISISPKEIVQLEDARYPVLPIHMDLEAEYRDIGLFLGALEGLTESLVTVRSFSIGKDEEILPLVKSKMVVDMYLQGGESGKR